MIAYQNPYFSVKLLENYYSIDFNNEQAIIMTTVEHKNFLFVKVKRNLLDASTIEFPSGSINSNESIIDGALREFREETGIIIKDKTRLTTCTPLSVMPSRFSQKLNVFSLNVSRNEFLNRKDHDNEIDDVFVLPFKETLKLINNEEIYVMGTLSLILKYFTTKEIIDAS